MLDSRAQLRDQKALPASYFDVDGTLISSNVLHPAAYYLSHQQTPLQVALRFGKTLANAPRMAMAELADRRTFNELLFSSYGGMSSDRLALLADAAFNTAMTPDLYPKAKDLIKTSRAAGHEIVLISGTLDFMLDRLADYFGGASIICNRLEIKDGYATGKLLKPVVAGPEKARLIREHARINNHDLNDCFAFSDSYSDVPMLSVVGHPAAVNPDRRLSLLAKAYSWPMFDLGVNT